MKQDLFKTDADKLIDLFGETSAGLILAIGEVAKEGAKLRQRGEDEIHLSRPGQITLACLATPELIAGGLAWILASLQLEKHLGD